MFVLSVTQDQQLGCPVAQRSPQLFKPADFMLSHDMLFMACPHSEGPSSLCGRFHLFSVCLLILCRFVRLFVHGSWRRLSDVFLYSLKKKKSLTESVSRLVASKSQLSSSL